jgi:hypothetical protein
MLAMLIADHGIVRRIPKLSNFDGRLSALHALANCIVVLDAFPDLVETLKHPNCAIIGTARSFATVHVFTALHLYHTLFLSMTAEDVYHHVVMALPGVLVGFTCTAGILTNSALFFGCGFPGAIRWSMLVLVHLGVVDAMTQKRVLSFVWTYVRGPGIVACVALSYSTMQFAVIPEWVAYIPWIVYVPMVILLINAAQYTGQVNKHYYEQRVYAKFESQGQQLRAQ